MKCHIVRGALGICLALTSVVSAFGQGVYWEGTMSGMHVGERVTKMYYMPKKFKAVTGADEQVMIVRLDKEVIYTLEPKDKTYSEMTFAEMETMMKKAGSKIDSQMEDLKKKMESMPEEQRKMVEKMMGDKMTGKGKEGTAEVSNTGEKKTINGYACTKFVIKQNGNEFMTVWATKDIKEFEPMRKDMEEFSKRMMAMNPMRSKGLVEAMKKIDGFPIETFLQGVKNVVTKVEKRTTASNEFEVPAGYTKVRPKMMENLEEKE